MEEAQQFVEGLIQTPSSQREQKEGEGSDEIMQEVPAEGVVDSEQTHTSEEGIKEPAKEVQGEEKEPAQTKEKEAE